MDISNLNEALRAIDIEDLQYVEKDLCFYELVSLGFLLYGEERSTAEFALQKLLVISNATAAAPSQQAIIQPDLLRTYAANVNKDAWRPYIVEALAIINARRVLRKLGLKWETISDYYLPHRSELRLHIHPLLKALYKICENMTPAQAGRLIFYMDENFRISSDGHLRFYDNSCLEVFLLDWITRRVIGVGDRYATGAELQVLSEYFKLNEMEEFKTLLTDVLKHNVGNQNSPTTDSDSSVLEKHKEENGSIENPQSKLVMKRAESLNDLTHRYDVRYESAGIVLIINQKEFYEDSNPALKHLLPMYKLTERNGTDLDRDIIKTAFSAHGYTPVVKENLTHIELLHCIRENAKRSQCHDSFVVCILSHGLNGFVCGSNSIPVAISEIEEIFAMNELEGKPKFLIVQACQKDEQSTNTSEKRKENPIRFADILKAMSTVPGFNALRYTSEGSWFIQILAKTIMDFGHRRHLSDIMMIVNAKVAEKRDRVKRNEVMLPMYISTLRGHFYLPKRSDIV